MKKIGWHGNAREVTVNGIISTCILYLSWNKRETLLLHVLFDISIQMRMQCVV